MFGAKQVQTLDVDKIMEKILENHDAKVVVDKLVEFLDKELDKSLAKRNDDEEIKKDAEKGYSWSYDDIFYNVNIPGEMLAEIIGYKVKPEDQGTFEIIQEKYKQFKNEKEIEERGKKDAEREVTAG